MFCEWNQLIQEMPVTLLIWPKEAHEERRSTCIVGSQCRQGPWTAVQPSGCDDQCEASRAVQEKRGAVGQATRSCENFSDPGKSERGEWWERQNGFRATSTRRVRPTCSYSCGDDEERVYRIAPRNFDP